MSGNYDGIILVLLVLIFIKLFFPNLVSTFGTAKLRPYGYDIQGTGNEPSDFFKLPVDLSCTPGPSKEAAYYATETPGGICGDGRFVNQQMKNYNIM